MGWNATLMSAGIALLMLVGAGWMNARRGIDRWSLVPWDYAMILSAILLGVALYHLADLWRNGAMP